MTERWRVTQISIVICKYFGISLEPRTVLPLTLLLARHFLLSQCLQTGQVRSRSLNLLVIGVCSSYTLHVPLFPPPLHVCLPWSPLVLPLLFIPIAGRRTAHKGRTVSRSFYKITIFPVEHGKSLTGHSEEWWRMTAGNIDDTQEQSEALIMKQLLQRSNSFTS